MNPKKVCWDCGRPATKSFKRFDNQLINEGGIKYRMPVLMSEVTEEDVQKAIDRGGSVPRFFCDDCYKRRAEELRKKQEEYGRLKKSLMLERAVRILEKQKLNIYDYKDTICQMEEFVAEHPEKFDSAHEMIAAIILVENRIKATMHYKIGKYTADIFIPSLKSVLEIDGAHHGNRLAEDNYRDNAIRSELGPDWEIVRIGTEYLEENAPMLVRAIMGVRDEKQRLRKENYGLLPEWYSKRERAVKKKKPLVGDENLFDI